MLDDLKDIIYHDCKYNFIFTDFEFSFKGTLFGKQPITEDVYYAYFFLSPYHLSEILVGINIQERTWDVELYLQKKSSLPLINSYKSKKGELPSDFDITNEFRGLLKNFENTTFLKEPTLPEAMEKLELFFSQLLLKKNIPYIAGSFSNKLMEQLTNEFDFNHPSFNTMMLHDKEKGILYKKIIHKLIVKENQPTHKTKKI